MDFLWDLGAHAALFALGLVIFAIGNRLLGRKNEGGKRLAVFVSGFGLVALSLFLCRNFYPDFKADEYPKALCFLLGAGGIGVGVFLVIASIAGSRKTLEDAFQTILSI